MTHRKNFHAAVVGGGIAGLTLAIALHHRQIPVTIYEQAPAFGEVGAGVSFGPNALEAMKVSHQGIYDAFELVRTGNLWPSKEKVWFDFFDGCNKGSSATAKNPSRQDIAFTVTNSLGQTGVHRAHFLDELIKLIPNEISRFNKRLEDIQESAADGKLVMKFADGSEDVADVVIGCDGIKSQVRRIIVGHDHPSADPSYTHKYAYRGLVPMEKAIEAVGVEMASNACMHMGPGGHVLTFPVNKGKTLNIVAFHASSDDWSDYPRLTRQGTRDEALRDFAGYGPNVISLLQLTDEKLSVWAIFDLGDHPVPSFHKGRICVSGDAAHATSPHHGAGAGFCLEDTAVLATLLEDPRVQTHQDLEAALAAFDTIRRKRAQWLVQSSRVMGNTYEFLTEGVNDDFQKIQDTINSRNRVVTDVDVHKICDDARKQLGSRLCKSTKGLL